METLGLDFGLVIAYVVPGLLTLKGISYRSPHVESPFTRLRGEGASALTLSLLLLLAIPAGAVTGVVRGVALDRSYSIGIETESRPSWLQEHWGPIPTVRIRYDKLAKGENLKAYREAKTDLLRPAEFYSNTIVALIVFAVGRFSTLVPVRSKEQRRAVLVEGVAYLVTIAVLYSGARWSMRRFAEAVNAINQV